MPYTPEQRIAAAEAALKDIEAGVEYSFWNFRICASGHYHRRLTGQPIDFVVQDLLRVDKRLHDDIIFISDYAGDFSSIPFSASKASQREAGINALKNFINYFKKEN